MPEACDCGASAVNSPGHSEWCSSLKKEDELDLHQLWVDDLYGLYPLEDDDEES